MHLLSVFSLRNRALIALITIVAGVFGTIAFNSLKQELIPSVTFPQLVVVTSYPGAAPDVVESDVSTPIETAIQAVSGLQDTTATSSTNLSSVSASFEYGTDIATVEQRVTLAINRIRSTLPADVDPQVITGSLDDLPVAQIAVTSDLPANELSTLLEGSALADFRALDGVRQVDLLGTSSQRVTITPDVDSLTAAGLTTQSIRDALDANGNLLPSGSITENDNTLTVQSGTRLGSTDDIGALPLVGATAPRGELVTIADVAAVAQVDDPITGISRVDGQPALTIAITKTPAGNTVDVSEEVRALLPGLTESLGSNTAFTVVFDQAPFIQQSIESLATEGSLGLLFAVIVILVFLLSIRSTIVTAISIPASVFITFIGMQASGYTLNVITLGAITIAVGRVVDDSIVVIENIKRHLSLGEEKLVAIQTAVKEVASAITASTVTTVAVFLPLALVGDITGELFRPFALTVTIALAASLFVALTIVPVLAYWLLKTPKIAAHVAGAEVAPESGAGPAANAASPDVARDLLEKPTRLQRSYLPIIRWTLRRPIATIIVALLVLGGTAALAPSLKTNFIGDSGQNTLTVTQRLPNGSSLATQDAAAKQVEAALIDLPGIDIVQLSIGSSGSNISQAFLGGSDISFNLTTDASYDQTELRTSVLRTVNAIEGVGRVSLAGVASGFVSAAIEINVTANSTEDLNTSSAALLAAVQDLPEVRGATSNASDTQPYIAINVDRDAAARAGLTEIQVGGIVSEAMLPTSVGSIVIDNDTLSIYIDNTLAPTTIQELADFQIPTATGFVNLSSLATVAQADGPSSVTTVKGLRAVTISVTPNSDDVGRASSAIQTAVDEADLPAGARAELGGVSTQQTDAFSSLGIALLIAILIVYVVMVATFKSLRQPLLLLISVPFAATGAILLQVASDIPLGVPSIIGALMLIGIVVTNAIVLVDLINQYRLRGLSAADAILEGASRRLRPILMTALATIFALLPLAIGLTGTGGFISQPLAIIVIGGLVSSTLLTLVVLPTLYYLVEGAKERRGDRRAAKAAGLPKPRMGETSLDREKRAAAAAQVTSE